MIKNPEHLKKSGQEVTMQTLESANVQKCVELLEDFRDAVPVDEGNRELLEKKKQADYALNHLTRLFDDVTVDEKFDVNDACAKLARNCK